MNDDSLLIAVEEARFKVHAAMEALQILLNVLNAKISAIQEKQRYLEELKVKRRQRHDKIASSIIKVNMRETIFEIEKDNLTRVDGSYFDVMLSMDENMIVDGSEASVPVVPVYFIDRSSEGFERIISNMKDGDGGSWQGLNGYALNFVQDNLRYLNINVLPKVTPNYTYTPSVPVLLFRDGGCMEVMIATEEGRLFITNEDTIYIIDDIDIDSTYGEVVLSGHEDVVNCLALLPDGRLCSGSDDQTIKIWNTSTGQCEMTLIGHMNVDSICALSVNTICSGSYATVMIWNIETGVCGMTLPGYAYSVAYVVQLADGRMCSYDYSIKFWNLESGICEKELTRRHFDLNVVIQLSDGRLSCGRVDSTIEIWNISSYICEHTLSVSGHTSGGVLSLVELFDGRLCSGSEDGIIRLWNIDDGVCEQTLTGHSHQIHSVLQLKDGRICSATRDVIITWTGELTA